MNRFASVTRPLMWFMAFMLAALTAGCGGGSGGGAPILGLPGVVSLTVNPPTATVPITGFQQYTATAVYSDGSSRNVTATSTWTKVEVPVVVATVVATLSPNGPAGGLATGTAAGTATITVAFGGRTATATLNVNAATSVSFKVIPTTFTIPVTGTVTYAAFETFSDGTSFDRTSASVWTTSGASAANAAFLDPICPAIGCATGKIITPAGTPVIITASYGVYIGAVGLVARTATLTVSAATSTKFEVVPTTHTIPVKGTQQYSAIETFSDGSTTDRTTVSAWITSGASAANAAFGDPLCPTIGCATGKIFTPAGTPVIITASYVGTVSYTGAFGLAARTATLTVTPATVVSILVTPAAATIAVGGTQQYTASAIFSDGSPPLDVTTNPGTIWASANIPAVPAVPAVATFAAGPPTGIATGASVGTSAITATYLANISPPVTLTVTLAPPPPVAACGGTGPLPLGTTATSASSFAVLAGAALSLTNPMTIIGNVGSPSITPAAGPSTLVGTQYDTASGSLPLIAAAVVDMKAAIACAVARPCDFSYAAAKDFGGSVGLLHGHHCVAGAMSVGSSLTLTDPGVYIFDATGALTSVATVTVKFAGLANSANSSVFWVSSGPGSSASIGATNTFLGSIMVDPGAITLGATTTLTGGRVLSSSAVTLSTNVIAIP